MSALNESYLYGMNTVIQTQEVPSDQEGSPSLHTIMYWVTQLCECLQGIADFALRWQEVKRSDPPVAHPSKSAPDSFQGNPPPNAPIIQGNCNPPDDPDSFKGNPSPNAPIVQDNCNPALDDPDSFQGNPSPNASIAKGN